MLSQYPKARLGVYLASLALSVAGIIVAVIDQSIGAAILTAAGVLSVAANATAVSNLTPKQDP